MLIIYMFLYALSYTSLFVLWKKSETEESLPIKHLISTFIYLCSLLVYVFSSDRCSITYPWLVLGVLVVLVLVLLFFLCRFNFSQELLGIIHCNFADMFSILLLNDSQSLNTFEILVWIFSRFLLPNLWT